jgi:hypothetical protein
MLACCVNIAEQTLRLAVQVNIPATRRGEKTIQRPRAPVSHIGHIAPIPRPLFDAQALASPDDFHGLAAVPKHQLARGVDLSGRVGNAHVDCAFWGRPAVAGRPLAHALYKVLQPPLCYADHRSR